MSLKEDLKSLFRDDYKLGIRQSTDVPVVYVNPNKFDEDYLKKNGSANPDDVKVFREMLDSQRPGFSAQFTDAELLDTIPGLISGGPLVMHIEHNGDKVCLANQMHDDLEGKDKFVKLSAGSHSTLIKHVPGSYDTWERAYGIHEGTHCNQKIGETPLSATLAEAEADQIADDWLNKHGYGKIARADADYRALGASDPGDLSHSVGIFLNVDGKNPNGLQELRAAESYKSDLVSIMNARIEAKYTPDQLEAMSAEQNEKMLITEVKAALAEGAFKSDNPFKEKFTRELIESLDNPDSKFVDAEQNIIDAEKNFNEVMQKEVEKRLAPGEKADDIRFSDPARYSKVLEDARKEGAFKNENPYIERYIDGYIDAYRRQIIEAKPDPVPVHRHKASVETEPANDALYAEADTQKPEDKAAPIIVASTPSGQSPIDVAAITKDNPEVDLSGGERASMKIGGVSASTYFASFADPASAQDRIEMAQNAPEFNPAQSARNQYAAAAPA